MSSIIRIETISQVYQNFGLGSPQHPLVSVIRFSEAIANYDFGDHRYVMDLYQITYKSGAEGAIGYGRNTYDFQEGTLVFTSPGQVLQFEREHSMSMDERAWTLLFHPDLIRKSPLGKAIDQYSFFAYDANEALHLSDEEKQSLSEIVDKIELECSSKIDKHTQKLIITNIELLLDYCLRYYDRQFYTRSNLNKDIVSRFEQLLKRYFNSDQPLKLGLPTVSYCGQMLNLSANYLSDLLKKETGRNTQEHIHFYLIEKAKSNLLSSSESISQIAYDLGFEYPQHFSKIFKSKTGMSPSEYRNLN